MTPQISMLLLAKRFLELESPTLEQEKTEVQKLLLTFDLEDKDFFNKTHILMLSLWLHIEIKDAEFIASTRTLTRMYLEDFQKSKKSLPQYLGAFQLFFLRDFGFRYDEKSYQKTEYIRFISQTDFITKKESYGY